MKKSLPKKLSKLMRVALADLAKAERSKYVHIDMGAWIKINNNTNYDKYTVPKNKSVLEIFESTPNCSVCFAGAVMVYSLDNPFIHNFDGKTQSKLFALDDVRNGNVASALGFVASQTQVNLWKERHGEDTFNAPQYTDNPKIWRKHMWKIVRKLERIGL